MDGVVNRFDDVESGPSSTWPNRAVTGYEKTWPNENKHKNSTLF